MSDFLLAIMMDSEDADFKIFETDEELVEHIKAGKIATVRLTDKQKRAKRRKENAKEKKCRRKMGTMNGNPYRGKPGNYYREMRMLDSYGLDGKIKKEYKKENQENREFLGKVTKEEQVNEVPMTENLADEGSTTEIPIVPENNYTLVQCFESGDYEMLGIYLANEFPREKVIEVLKALDETAE